MTYSPTNRPTIAVNGIVFGADEQVLLTRRADTGQWCIPGGMLECGETLREAVVRELMEEAGIKVSVERCVGIYSEPNLEIIPPATMHLVVVAFECTIPCGAPMLSEEVSAVSYFAIDDLPDIVITHPRRIRDALNRDESPIVT